MTKSTQELLETIGRHSTGIVRAENAAVSEKERLDQISRHVAAINRTALAWMVETVPAKDRLKFSARCMANVAEAFELWACEQVTT